MLRFTVYDGNDGGLFTDHTRSKAVVGNSIKSN